MRWPIFLIVAFVTIVIDTSFIGVLQLQTLRGIAPSLSIALVVFICLFASRLSALAGAFLLGVMMDFSSPLSMSGGLGTVSLLGPHALGFLFAGYLIVQMRTMVFRQRSITIGALSTIAWIAAALVAITIFLFRSWYGDGVNYPTSGGAVRELLRQIGIGIYSGLLAIPVGWALLATIPAWGFQAYHARRTIR